MAKTGGSVYSVSQVNSYIHQLFDMDILLSRVFVRGEISNCKYHSSGHIYFSLKDEKAQIRCVMFASHRRNLNITLKDGLTVIVFGQISVYERDGSYQLYASAVRPDGIGALYERYEALKKELLEMGMFDEQYKQPVPRYVSRLGVVTAPTGAAVRDIINVSKRRNPGVSIFLYPAQVQGEGAAESIVRGIQTLDMMDVDVIIVGRGGGSIEDLWAFNEEIVARAIFECRTCVISAVGHETDTTIADYVADLRAPTPSAGAELAIDDMIQAQMDQKSAALRLSQRMRTLTAMERHRLKSQELRLKLGSPTSKLRQFRQTLDMLAEKADQAMRARIEAEVTRKDRLQERIDRLMDGHLREARRREEILKVTLESLSPEKRLSDGYAYIEDKDGRALGSARDMKKGDALKIWLSDGGADVRIEDLWLKREMK